jgi:hypothetical protein
MARLLLATIDRLVKGIDDESETEEQSEKVVT